MSSGNFNVTSKYYEELFEEGIWLSQKEDLTLNSSKSVVLKGKDGGVEFKKYDPAKLRKHFVRGWWTDDKNRPIAEAQVGHTVHFHVQTKNIPDGKAIDLDLLSNKNKNRHAIPYCGNVKNNKVVIYFKIDDDLIDFLGEQENTELELYFRCSYNPLNASGEHKLKDEHEESILPDKSKDYLKVLLELNICIDIYRVPGLNEQGIDIADDMSYGFGDNNNYQVKNQIYTKTGVEKYKQQYINTGFDEQQHALYANSEGVKSKAKYSKAEIVTAVPNIASIINHSDKELFSKFRNLAKIFAQGKLGPILKDMIDKFERREGGIFENKVLTQAVQENPSTQRFCTSIEGVIKQRINYNEGKLKRIEDKNIYYKGDDTDQHGYGHPHFDFIQSWKPIREGAQPAIGDIKNLPKELANAKNAVINDAKNLKELADAKNIVIDGLNRLAEAKDVAINDAKSLYNGVVDAAKNTLAKDIGENFGNTFGGLVLAIHDVWAYKILLKQYTRTGDDYKATYEVTLWDHFGFDLSDIKKFNSLPGIEEFFVLQHLRGYKPFLTKVQFEKTFSDKVTLLIA